jgi:hypothetical protein
MPLSDLTRFHVVSMVHFWGESSALQPCMARTPASLSSTSYTDVIFSTRSTCASSSSVPFELRAVAVPFLPSSARYGIALSPIPKRSYISRSKTNCFRAKLNASPFRSMDGEPGSFSAKVSCSIKSLHIPRLRIPPVLRFALGNHQPHTLPAAAREPLAVKLTISGEKLPLLRFPAHPI